MAFLPLFVSELYTEQKHKNKQQIRVGPQADREYK